MDDQTAMLRQMAQERAGAFEKGGAAGKTRIIAVTSGKGGVGKSSVALNMAIAYAQMGKKVILVDADLGLGNIHVLLDVVPQYNLSHVITRQKSLSDIIYKTDYGIRIIAGPNGHSRVANLAGPDRAYFIGEMESLANADIVIIDTSAGSNENVLDFVVAADEVILITTPEPTAVTDAYGLLKILTSEFEDYDIVTKLLVNRVHSAKEGKKIFDKMSNVVAQFLNYKLEYLGFIFDDPAVANAIIRRKPFVLSAQQSKAAFCVKHLVSRIEKIELDKDPGVGGFIQRLFRK